jgi:hypothetical protein
VVVESENGQRYQIEDITPYPGGGAELNPAAMASTLIAGLERARDGAE